MKKTSTGTARAVNLTASGFEGGLPVWSFHNDK